MSCSPVSSPVRVSFTAQGSSVNTRPGVAATPLASQRFQPPTSFPSVQQNGYHSPPRSVPKLPTGAPVVNGHRMASTALVSFRNVQRHLQSTQMNLSELHQAVEPVSFHTSEPLHDAASRLLSVSLRFGRRLPCFRRLPFRDQVILLEEGWKEMLLLDSVFWAFTLTQGGSPESENDQRRQQEIKKMQEALMPLNTLKLDSSEYACLKAVVLFRTSKLPSSFLFCFCSMSVKIYNSMLLTKCEVKMDGYWPSSFLSRVYGPRRSRGPLTRQKITRPTSPRFSCDVLFSKIAKSNKLVVL